MGNRIEVVTIEAESSIEFLDQVLPSHMTHSMATGEMQVGTIDEQILSCETARVALEHFINLGLENPNYYTVQRVKQMLVFLVNASRTTSGFMQRNIEERLCDFSLLLADGFFDSGESPDFMYFIRRLNVLTTNFERELVREDLSSEYKAYGESELTLIAQICEKTVSNAIGHGIGDYSELREIRSTFESFLNLSNSRKLEKIELVEIGLKDVCAEVKELLHGIVNVSTSGELGTRIVEPPVPSWESLLLESSRSFGNLRFPNRTGFYFISVILNPMLRKRLVRLTFTEESMIEWQEALVASKKFRGEEQRSSTLAGSPDEYAIQLSQADDWLTESFPSKTVVFSDSWDQEELTRTVFAASEDWEVADREYRRLSEKGLSDLCYLEIECDQEVDV